MLRTKTVLIVGAGASREADLPDGKMLKTTISQKLEFGAVAARGDQSILRALINYYGEPRLSEALQVCRRISEGVVYSTSIDDYIDAHRANEMVATCGKLAIWVSILEAERVSYMRIRDVANSFSFEDIGKSWYVPFFSLLASGIPLQAIENMFDDLSIVCFNYDRCIEHFLVNALRIRYHIDLVKASEIVKTIKIYRPYGLVGDYFQTGQQQFTPFGADQRIDVDSICRNLRTYSESFEDPQRADMQNAIRDAGLLVFLGNSYLENNMSLLGDHRASSAEKRVYATMLGIKPADLFHVRKDVLRLCRADQGLAGPQADGIYFSERCSDLFDDHRIGLAR